MLLEAVLLAYYAITHMRRRLVIIKPQEQASMDTIALYREYLKPDREDLR